MQHLKLHEEVRLVNGYLRAVAYDLPRSTFTFLPKDLVAFLLENDRAPVELFESNPVFVQHATLLNDNEIFFTEDAELIAHFPPLSLEWKSPFVVNSVVIDIAGFDETLIQKQAWLFKTLNVKHVHYNMLQLPSIDDTERFLSLLEDTPLQSVIILVKDPGEGLASFCDQCAGQERITMLLLPHDVEGPLSVRAETAAKLMYYHPEKQPRRLISNFTINMKVFTEAQQHNVYFNKKLYIDAEGNLRNTPETPEIIGHLLTIPNKDELMSLLSSEAFTRYGRVPKDKCEVCNHCEFRYMCIDDRVPLQRPEGHYYFETACGYNPFIAKWEGEDGFLPVSDCGLTINGLDEPIVEEEKYEAIVKDLWD